MASSALGQVLRQIHRLFDAGTVAGQSDAELLARFAARRDEPAFEALVARHGLSFLLGGPNEKHQEFDMNATIEAKGRFHIVGLIPGLSYGAVVQEIRLLPGQPTYTVLGTLFEDLQVEPGQTKDLGDVKIQPTRP